MLPLQPPLWHRPVSIQELHSLPGQGVSCLQPRVSTLQPVQGDKLHLKVRHSVHCMHHVFHWIIRNRQCSTAGNRLCLQCLPGSITNTTNAASCTVCPAGSYSSAPATACLDCLAGTNCDYSSWIITLRPCSRAPTICSEPVGTYAQASPRLTRTGVGRTRRLKTRDSYAGLPGPTTIQQ